MVRAARLLRRRNRTFDLDESMSNIYRLLSGSVHAIDEVERLVRAGADLESRSLHVSGRTVLEMVCSQSDVRYVHVVSRLVALGADVNSAHPKSGATPLHLAAFYAPPAVVGRLCEVGADVNAVDREGRSPAFLTLERNGSLAAHMQPILASLFGAGADPHARDGKGTSLLQATRDPDLKAFIRAAQTVSNISGAVNGSSPDLGAEDAPAGPTSRNGLQPL
jgi:ankyrin repeat protein